MGCTQSRRGGCHYAPLSLGLCRSRMTGRAVRVAERGQELRLGSRHRAIAATEHQVKQTERSLQETRESTKRISNQLEATLIPMQKCFQKIGCEKMLCVPCMSAPPLPRLRMCLLHTLLTAECSRVCAGAGTRTTRRMCPQSSATPPSGAWCELASRFTTRRSLWALLRPGPRRFCSGSHSCATRRRRRPRVECLPWGQRTLLRVLRRCSEPSVLSYRAS